MGKKLKTFYPENPTPWINLLSKHNIVLYPEMVEGKGETFAIVVQETLEDGRLKVIKGKKTYSVDTVNRGLLDALKYMYEKYKEL